MVALIKALSKLGLAVDVRINRPPQNSFRFAQNARDLRKLNRPYDD